MEVKNAVMPNETQLKEFNEQEEDKPIFMVNLLKFKKLAQYPDLAAKIAELIPMYPDDVKAVLVSKRIAIDESEINTILDIVRQHVGFE